MKTNSRDSADSVAGASTSPPRRPPSSLLILLFALATRTGYWIDGLAHPEHGYAHPHVVMGTPISDAAHWDQLAADLARGRDISHDSWSARRPVYAWLLALFYAWTGPQYQVGQAVNVIAGAVAIRWIYEGLCLVAGVPAALAVALTCAVDPPTLALGAVTMSETMGWFFLAAHFRALASSVRGTAYTAGWSGLLLALSNLTRSLTLFALPLEMVALGLVRWRAGEPFRRAARTPLMLGFGTVITILPFVAWQYHRHRIPALSDNMAAILYAASDPKHGVWTAAVELEADVAGKKSLAERYNFFMTKARQNIASDPWAFSLRVQATIRRGFEVMAERRLLLVTVILTLWGAIAFRRRPRRFDSGVDSVLLGRVALLIVGGVGLEWSVGAWALPWLLALVATASALRCRPERPLILLIALLAGSMVALGLFANLEPRMLVLVWWMFAGLVAAGTCDVISLALGLQATPEPYEEQHALSSAWRRRGWMILATVLALSAVRLAMIRLGPAPEIPLVVMTEAQRLAFLDAVRTQTPIDHRALAGAGTLTERESAAVDGEWLLIVGGIERHSCWLSADAEARGDETARDDGERTKGRAVPVEKSNEIAGARSPLAYVPRGFEPRDSDRSVGWCFGRDQIGRTWNHIPFVFAGPRWIDPQGEYGAMLGRLRIDRSRPLEEHLLEAIAFAPWDPVKKAIAIDRLRLVSEKVNRNPNNGPD